MKTDCGCFGILLLILVLSNGCAGSRPARFYLLEAVPAPEELRSSLVIGIAEPSLEQYLDRPQLVERSGASEVRFLETSRWAEPLQGNMAAVLREDLARFLPGSRVHLYPFPQEVRPDLLVAIHIMRFEFNDAGEAILNAQWRMSAAGARVQEGCREYREGRLPHETNLRIGAMNRLLAALSRDLADTVAQMQ